MLKTKLFVPESKDRLVQRERLLHSISEGFRLGKRLIAVVAPAGYGKSTLLAQWANHAGMPCAWLSVDARDNDPVRFWRYFTASIASALPEQHRQQLEANCQLQDGVSIYTFLDALISGLPEETDHKHAFALLLDDLHEITTPSILEGLSYLFDYMPDSMHVLLSSRSELMIPGIKRLANGEAMVVGMGQLQFTASETESLFRMVNGEPHTEWTSAQLDELQRKTEGWITGLQLLSLSRPFGNDSLMHLAYDGESFISDYLFQEVLHLLSSDLHDFLLRTSVLSRMDAPACNALTGRTDGGQQLEELQRLNLFLIPLDGTRTWFRYHHLFAQFLQGQLRRRDEKAYAAMHRAAGLHFSEIGAMEDAIDHLFEAGEIMLAIQALERHLPAALRQGDLSTLLNWFRRIPEACSLTLELSLLHAFLLVLAGDLERSGRVLEQLEEEIDRLSPSSRQDQLRSSLLFVRSNLVFLNGDFAGWLASSEKVRDHLAPDNPVYYQFDYNRQEPYVRRTSLGMKGRLSKDTEKVGKLFIEVLEGHGWKNSLLHLYVKQCLAEGYYEWNRLVDCRELLMQLRNSDKLRETPGLLIPVLLTEARLHAAEGKSALAYHTLDEAAEAAAACIPDGGRWGRYVRAVRSNLYLRDGRLGEAKKELAPLHIGSGSKPVYSRETEFLALVRLLGRQRKEAEALPMLELLKLQAEREQQIACRVEITCLQALLEAQRGQRLLAFSLIEEALVLGKDNDYRRTFVDEGADMQLLLKAYLADRYNVRASASGSDQGLEQLGPLLDYVEKLIHAFPGTPGIPAHQRSLPVLDLLEPLSSKELLLLEQLRLGATNKQMAAALGLTEGTIRVYLSRLYEKLGVSTRTQALVKTQSLPLSGK
ncbi:LuxR C-terminal-related transcriptional regulator [Paenibacillus antibioticophila]|uniref:LuxR C-terminal-related transcriptional regulator n=1 Tax=Paenibacillus antibioticophila TaxID=1274374 RepID=UPI001F30503D|nr:LuxR C-terminal-related transcriptional regulator [Paenibacillus antibioticophila]